MPAAAPARQHRRLQVFIGQRIVLPMPYIQHTSRRPPASFALHGTRVGIVGAGAVAFGSAAVLVKNGHDPMLWSPSGSSTRELHCSNSREITSVGAIESIFAPRIAQSAKQLAEENEALLLALPTNGHLAVMTTLAPHVRSDQIIIISSHSSLGALYLSQLLARRDVQAPIVAWGTTAVTARRPSERKVQVCTVRSQVDMCTVPESASDRGMSVCRFLFGDNIFKERDGLLAISLSNVNAQNHLGIILGNMSRMERGENWSQGLNITPNVGRLLEALDEERLAIAEAVGVQVRTVREHFSLSFHVPVGSVYEMNQQMVAKGNDVNGPNTADSRYVTEDVPYGLPLVTKLGRMVGRPAILHESGIRIISAMYDRDFESENDLLRALGLSDLTIQDIVEAGKTGILQRSRVDSRRQKGVAGIE